jgi:hypothetical protein
MLLTVKNGKFVRLIIVYKFYRKEKRDIIGRYTNKKITVRSWEKGYIFVTLNAHIPFKIYTFIDTPYIKR